MHVHQVFGRALIFTLTTSRKYYFYILFVGMQKADCGEDKLSYHSRSIFLELLVYMQRSVDFISKSLLVFVTETKDVESRLLGRIENHSGM